MFSDQTFHMNWWIHELSTTCYVAVRLETNQVLVIPTTSCESFSENFNFMVSIHKADNYMFKVNNRNTKTRSEICSVNHKDTRATSLESFWCLYCELWIYFVLCYSVSIVNFKQVNAGWRCMLKENQYLYFMCVCDVSIG